MQNVTEDRELYIGGSDAPVIMNLSPFKTRWELLQEKAGIKEPDFTGNKYTEYGNIMEPKIREYVNGKLLADFIEDKTIDGDLRYHADGHDLGTNQMLEIKTTSHVSENINGYKHYLVQLLLGMKMNKSETGWLAVYERPEDFDEEFNKERLCLFKVEFSEYTELVKEIDYYIQAFREDLAKLRENPFLTEEELMPNELVELANKVVAFEDQLTEYKRIENECKKFKENLKLTMELYGLKSWKTNSGHTITLVPDGEDKEEMVLDMDSLKSDLPELFKPAFDGGYMVTRIKKGRAGYVRITQPK